MRVTIRLPEEDDELWEFLCDAPDCPEFAREVIGISRYFGAYVLCEKHAQELRDQAS